MELMGPSLADLIQFCGNKFSLKTTIMLANQLMERFEYIHSKNFIHRDIKPDNFLMGLMNKSPTLHVVDMGLAKKYFVSSTNSHIPFKTHKSLTGTARYASIHAHLGEELSRRDDLEAIGYVLIYFYLGGLPWQNLRYNLTKSKKYKKIKNIKLNTNIRELCRGCPTEFYEYMRYVMKLSFEEKPDYGYLKKIWISLAQREGINLNDNRYDWCVKAVAIQRQPMFYEQMKANNAKMLDDNGNFAGYF